MSKSSSRFWIVLWGMSIMRILIRDHRLDLMPIIPRMQQTVIQSLSDRELITQYLQWFLQINSDNHFIVLCQWWIRWCHHHLLHNLTILPTATVLPIPRDLAMVGHHLLRFSIQHQMDIHLIHSSNTIRWCHKIRNSRRWCNNISSRNTRNSCSSNGRGWC